MPSPSMIAITAGDSCGVGPEIILKTLPGLPRSIRQRVMLIGDHHVFERTAARLRRRLPAWYYVPVRHLSSVRGGQLTFLDLEHGHAFVPRHTTRAAGAASLAYLDTAVALWRARRIHALVTAPVTKWAINLSHPRFVGQTEYLAQALKVRDVVMMFVSDRLRVVLMTRHLPLRAVAKTVDRRLLRVTLRRTHDVLAHTFRISHPKLALCGLNPHAGEGGLFGDEERGVLLPVMRQLRREGLICEGPFAADGFFAQPCTYDAVICWYHDQGLIPFKMAARDHGCQMSVGLPLLRTSPDHGSALDIAGKGIAHPGSMRYAIQLAAGLMDRPAPTPKLRTSVL